MHTPVTQLPALSFISTVYHYCDQFSDYCSMENHCLHGCKSKDRFSNIKRGQKIIGWIINKHCKWARVFWQRKQNTYCDSHSPWEEGGYFCEMRSMTITHKRLTTKVWLS